MQVDDFRKLLLWFRRVRVKVTNGDAADRADASRSLLEWVALTEWGYVLDARQRRAVLREIDALVSAARYADVAPLRDDLAPDDVWRDVCYELERARSLAQGIGGPLLAAA